jgi:hypothetical protein
MNEITISSFGDLVERLFEKSWDQKIKRFRSHYVFRGLSDENYQLKTTLTRLGRNYESMEKLLLRNFRKYAHRDVVPQDSIWNWLSIAEHHGLPTRLLDWTISPLVAAHFATCNVEKFNVNGAIWCVDFIANREMLPNKLKSLLKKERSYALTMDMLNEAAKSLDEFDALSRSAFVAFFQPPSLDERIANQYALFSIMSNPKALLDDWLKRHPSLYRKLIIPANLKWEIRDKLDKANITERVFFPGLDGLCSWLKRYYTPLF